MQPIDLPHPLVAAVFLVLCGLALTVTWLARVSEGSAAQVAFQWLFLGSLLVMCTSTAVAIHSLPGNWFMLTGATCGLMIVAGVYDPGAAQIERSRA
ncbi:MAG: hypothetical protein K1X74_09080 [Pirellulales bacterium]|nr:hypothetical protein [Pirellulales bacterium]